MRISLHIPIRKREMENPSAVATAKPVVPIIASTPLLCNSRNQSKDAGFRMEANITPIDIDHLAGLFTSNFSTKKAIGTVYPIVETE